MVDKIACVIVCLGKRFEGLGKCAKNSFEKYHKDIDMHYITESNLSKYATGLIKHIGVFKYQVAYNLMKNDGYSRVICLGADTITCARLDEFLDNNESVLASLDYPYQLKSGGFSTPDDQTHLNADVVCFTNINAVKEIISLYEKHGVYGEQGSLNEVVWSKRYSFKIVDYPYKNSKVVYNVRSKGNICAVSGTKPWKKYTLLIKVVDGKLYTHENKQIKVWHYCEGLGNLNIDKFNELLYYWKNEWFNNETKRFFSEQCNCGDFFKWQS